jgi:hypothetical protein
MVEDVLKALRVSDGREPAMGRAWLTMNNLKKHIFNLRNPPFNLRVGFNDAIAELTEYEERRGPYNPVEAPDIREAHMEPHQWWHRIGSTALLKIAKHILLLTCSTSSCERNWSIYSFVHSKSRNRLRVNKAEALVYIYTNSKLLRQRPGTDPVRWYNNNIFSEDLDPDDNGHETKSEENDDGGNDDDGQNLEAFDWDGFSDDGVVGGAYARNRSSTPTGDGGVTSNP